jgi:hypothetical protein
MDFAAHQNITADGDPITARNMQVVAGRKILANFDTRLIGEADVLRDGM